MSVEIGVLLGQPGGTQSFEDVGSWSLAAAQCSLALQATDVHSSARGALLSVFSGASGLLRYDYLAADDALARWDAGANSHRIVAQGWARVSAAAWSGQVSAAIASAALPLAFSPTLRPFRLETVVGSGDPLRLEFRLGAGLTGSGALYLDDILVTADALALGADWTVKLRRTLAAGRHSTLGGRDSALAWGERPRLEVPVRYVSAAATDRMRGWWSAGWPLLFTLDTSDAQAQWPVRLGGTVAPLGAPSPPYWNAWQGTLLLEGLTPGLDF
jgi:hypothetical protein